MPTFYPSITPDLREWALAQPIFFIATAPTHGAHINLSPKGIPSRCLRVTGPNRCAYLDLTGSGCETVAHLNENGRATLMWCSFGPSPRIMRWFCRGRVVEAPIGSQTGDVPKDASGNDDDEEAVRSEWAEWRTRFGDIGGARAVIVLDVFKTQTSCGFAVPYAAGQAPSQPAPALNDASGDAQQEKIKAEDTFIERPTLETFAKKMSGRNAMCDYRAKNNCSSLDGLPGLRSARHDAGYWVRLEDCLPGATRSVCAALNAVLVPSSSGNDSSKTKTKTKTKTNVGAKEGEGESEDGRSRGTTAAMVEWWDERRVKMGSYGPLLAVLVLGWIVGVLMTWFVMRGRSAAAGAAGSVFAQKIAI